MAKTIITIGRQFGSNGRNIGRKLAEKISANFYDKELINETAKESGLSEEFLKSLDENQREVSCIHLFLIHIAMDSQVQAIRQI